MRRATCVLILITAALLPLSFCGRISSRRRPHLSRRKHSSMEVSDSNLIQESVPSYETYEYLSKYYSFVCEPQRKTGYYGDPLYDCRIFHVCHLSGQATFFCPALTKFNNYLQICDREQKIDKKCELYGMKEEPEFDRYSNYHPIDHYPLPPVPLTVKHVAAPQYVPVTSEEQHYRNKYKEVQEYYGPFKNRAPQSLKSSVMLLPQPLFNYVNENPRYNGKEFYQEDEQSNASQEVTPSPTARTSTEEDKAAESKQSKYGNQQALIQIPPANNLQLLQTSSNGHRGLTEGKSVAAVAAVERWKGRTTEVDSNTMKLKNTDVGFEDGSIIELWIPTKVKRISTS